MDFSDEKMTTWAIISLAVAFIAILLGLSFVAFIKYKVSSFPFLNSVHATCVLMVKFKDFKINQLLYTENTIGCNWSRGTSQSPPWRRPEVNWPQQAVGRTDTASSIRQSMGVYKRQTNTRFDHFNQITIIIFGIMWLCWLNIRLRLYRERIGIRGIWSSGQSGSDRIEIGRTCHNSCRQNGSFDSRCSGPWISRWWIEDYDPLRVTSKRREFNRRLHRHLQGYVIESFK